MIENFMYSEIWQALVSCAPAISAILATVISAILAIKKVATVIAEFRNSNELKEATSQVNKLLEDNKQLKKLNEKLLVELTRIKPVGWCNDKEGVVNDKNEKI